MSTRFIITYVALRQLETLDYSKFIELLRYIKVDCGYSGIISDSIAVNIIQNLIKFQQTKILRYLRKYPDWNELCLQNSLD